jgi:hypothetical protein
MELEEQIQKVRDLYDEYKAKDKVAKDIYHEVESEEIKLKQMLEDLDGVEYAELSKKFKVGLKVQHSAKVPQEEEARKAFFQWLKDKDYFDQYITVHSASINKLVNDEAEANEVEVKDLSIPGLVISKRVTVKY